ncbi:hypothetical protein ABZX30_31650 [Streptomyces sp. NPDC004542]
MRRASMLPLVALHPTGEGSTAERTRAAVGKAYADRSADARPQADEAA